MLGADEMYRCGYGAVFIDDQIRYERHLANGHNRLRDVLWPVLDALLYHQL